MHLYVKTVAINRTFNKVVSCLYRTITAWLYGNYTHTL